MRTEQIIYLREIHNTSSLIMASKNLHISVQALSSSMNNLEKEIGVTLLNRSRHGSVLTASGLKLLADGQTFLECIDAIKNNSTEKYPYLRHAIIDLAITNGMMETYFPPLATQFRQDFPKSCLNFNRTNCTELLNDFRRQKFSAISALQIITVNGKSVMDLPSNLEMKLLLKGNFFCIVHPNSKLYHYNSISLKTMLKYDTLIYSPSQDTLNALINISEGAKKIIYVSEFSVFQNMIQNGVGSSFLSVSDGCTYQYSDSYKLIPFKEKINFYVILAYPQNISLEPQIEEFINYTEHFFRTHTQLAVKY